MKHVQFQLEEKMGDGRWARVYRNKEELGYEDEDPSYLYFSTKKEAREFAQKGGNGRWASGAIKRDVVRIIEVCTTITVVK